MPIRQFDDGHSDPDLIATQYRVGRNAFFEVQLTLAEFADAQRGGGTAGSPNLVAAIGIGEGSGAGCPEVSQWFRTDNHVPVRAGALVGKQGIPIYNPITRNFNKLRRATLRKNVPLVLIASGQAKNLVSDSHQIITRPFDRIGKNLRKYRCGDVLTFNDAVSNGQKNFNIYQDVFTIEPAGRGDVVEIELETEFIYVSGMECDSGVVAHNRKPLE
jgi:hypothetical protein